jgi:hypothetical protein
MQRYFFESFFPEFFAPSTAARGENSRQEKTKGAVNNKLHEFDAEKRRTPMERSWGMTTIFMLAGHSEKRKQVDGANQVAWKFPANPENKKMEGVGRAREKRNVSTN